MGWFSWPFLIMLFALPLLMVLRLQGEAWPALLAYINCVFGITAVILFARKARIDCAVPVLFLPLLVVAWPLASIYFAMFYPKMSYGLIHVSVKMLTGNDKMQLSVLLFLCGYLPIVFLATWGSTLKPGGYTVKTSAVVNVVAVLAIIILTVNGISKIQPFPGPMVYVFDGLLIYSQGLLFLPGALITRTSRAVKVLLAVFLPFMVFFYTLGNARGMAMVPIAMFTFGILFFSDIKNKTKFVILGAIILLLPTYVVVGNTTRVLTGSIGFNNLEKRWDALQRWEEVTDKTPVVASTFGRLFFTGGHSIITRTPEERPFLPFELGLYVKEIAASLLPGRSYYEPVYRGNRILSEYGFLITKQTSVEVSMLGNLWLLGGYPFIFLGGLAAGLLHWFLMAILRMAKKRNALMGLLFLGVVGSTLLRASGQDIISQFRTIVWHLIFAWVFWLVTATLSGYWWSRKSKESIPGC